MSRYKVDPAEQIYVGAILAALFLLALIWQYELSNLANLANQKRECVQAGGKPKQLSSDVLCIKDGLIIITDKSQ